MIEQRNKIEQARRGNWFDRIKQAIKDFNLTLHDVARQKRGFLKASMFFSWSKVTNKFLSLQSNKRRDEDLRLTSKR